MFVTDTRLFGLDRPWGPVSQVSTPQGGQHRSVLGCVFVWFHFIFLIRSLFKSFEVWVQLYDCLLCGLCRYFPCTDKKLDFRAHVAFVVVVSGCSSLPCAS